MTVAAALTLRMRFLQVEQADRFRLLADENRINIRLIPPARGRIFDRGGAIIADNLPSYRITIIREEAAATRPSPSPTASAGKRSAASPSTPRRFPA